MASVAAAPTRLPERPARWSLSTTALRGCAVGLGLVILLELVRVFGGTNLHTVIPGAVYRSSQPSPASLATLVRSYGIKTVINLRGCCDPEPQYLTECRTTSEQGISQEDIGFSSGRLPPVPSIRELIRVLDGSEKPVLLHCHKGIDRTGMASAVALLLYTDTTLTDARRQLGLRYGHLPIGRTGNMDRFLDLYSEWLTARRLAHSREVFRRWAEHEYCAGECHCAIEVLEPATGPIKAASGRPFGVPVRCSNTSVKPWEMRPGNNAGVHARWTLVDANNRLAATGCSGLFRQTVMPGDHVDLTLALPPLPAAGCYHLRVDMEDERHASFFQEGSEPLFVEVEVP